MSSFDALSVGDALEVALGDASHLVPQHAGAVAAARALARKIDEWDVIAQWAADDALGSERSRPAVPQHDNVSLSTFLKYLEVLGLVPGAKSAGANSARPANDLAAFKQKRLIG